MGRLASLTSVLPAQKKFEKPAPVPVELTVTAASGLASKNASPRAIDTGYTVELPAMATDSRSPRLAPTRHPASHASPPAAPDRSTRRLVGPAPRPGAAPIVRRFR